MDKRKAEEITLKELLTPPNTADRAERYRFGRLRKVVWELFHNTGEESPTLAMLLEYQVVVTQGDYYFLKFGNDEKYLEDRQSAYGLKKKLLILLRDEVAKRGFQLVIKRDRRGVIVGDWEDDGKDVPPTPRASSAPAGSMRRFLLTYWQPYVAGHRGAQEVRQVTQMHLIRARSTISAKKQVDEFLARGSLRHKGVVYTRESLLLERLRLVHRYYYGEF
jgi:hypothetical protein